MQDGIRLGIYWHAPFHVFHTVIETQLLANQSSHFENVILYNNILYVFCSAFADKQSIKKPLMLFKNKEKISLKLNNGDKKEIEVCPIDFHYLEFKQIVPELFGEGELYEYEVKLKDKAISKENYLECFQVDAVDVIKKPKARAVDPTTEGSNRGFRGIGLTRYMYELQRLG